MREIKFRGREVDTGRVVYGYYLESATTSWIRDNETKTYVPVEPESVAQLIGHDSQGREVYEGDKLTDKAGNIWFVKSKGYAIYESGCEDITRDLDELTLVEAVA